MAALTIGIPLAGDHGVAAMSFVDGLCAQSGVALRRQASPHISLAVVLQSPDVEVVDELVAEAARRFAAFSVRARGVGLFTGVDDDDLVLYAPVVRSERLARLHRALFDTLTAADTHVEGHYHPDAWLPHVTLCHEALTPERVGIVASALARSHGLAWTLPVERLARLGPNGAAAMFPLVGTDV
jgi:2'-5' RNA ligase